MKTILIASLFALTALAAPAGVDLSASVTATNMFTLPGLGKLLEVTAGEPLNVSITVSNKASNPATGCNLAVAWTVNGTAVLWPPNHVVVVTSQGSFTLAGSTVNCNLGDLGPRQNATVQLTLDTAGVFEERSDEIQTLELGLAVTAAEAELNPGDNQDAATARVFARRDFGDAPARYPTKSAANGARHRVGNLYLGAAVDPEADGQPGSTATGDDKNGSSNDEDGVVFGPVMSGGTATITVTASASGRLDAWADFNRDGVWSESERIFNRQPVVSGANTLAFPVPAGLMGGMHYFRFRLSSAGGLAPTGYATDGEVEDYRVFLRQAIGWQPRLDLNRVGNQPVISWSGSPARLEQADTLTGPWVAVPNASSPYVPATTDEHKFYRLRIRDTVTRLETRVREADLIFEGVVTSVEYRNSSVDAEHPLSWPHTFVTFQNMRVVKGRLAGETVTLRFVGGVTPDDQKILRTSHSTLFDVGERSILFVRRNGRWSVPLAGGEQGRFRVINDNMVTEDGREVLWTDEALMAYGQYQAHPEVVSNRVGNLTITRARSSEEAESGPTALPVGGQPMSKARFLEVLSQLIQLAHTPEELANFPVTASADINAPFHINGPRPAPPKPSVTRPVAVEPETPEDLLERQQWEANGYDPVLP